MSLQITVRLLFAVLAITLAISGGQLASAQIQQESPAKPAGADDFYRGDEVQSIHLRVAKEDLQRMRAALPHRISVKGSFRWRDISVDNVAIRFKGNSSSQPTQPRDAAPAGFCVAKHQPPCHPVACSEPPLKLAGEQ